MMARLTICMGLLLMTIAAGGCRRTVGPVSSYLTAPAPLQRFDRDLWILSDEFRFIDATGKAWTAPRGTLTDGASIPGMFLSFTGDRLQGTHLDAAVVHDAYCGGGNEENPYFHAEPWPAVHRMFYEACVAAGTGEMKARLMYAAVYLGGPRWDDPQRNLSGVDPSRMREELTYCLNWIESVNPSVETIEGWMQDREARLKADP